MRSWPFTVALLLIAAQASAGDCLVRIGYPDRERYPYYVGNGSEPTNPPGVGVELLSRSVLHAGCKVALVRLPPARLKLALASGAIDLTPYDFIDGEILRAALPLAADGKPDRKRALRTMGVVYVRKADVAAAGANPRAYFKQHRLAALQGAALAAQLRAEGMNLDDGASDTMSNFEKVMLKRADGVAITVVNEKVTDGVIAGRYGGAMVRIETPIKTSYTWFATNKAFYESHRQQVESIWNWSGTQAPAQHDELLKKYAPR
jgi:hypothetical protein